MAFKTATTFFDGEGHGNTAQTVVSVIDHNCNQWFRQRLVDFADLVVSSVNDNLSGWTQRSSRRKDGCPCKPHCICFHGVSTRASPHPQGPLRLSLPLRVCHRDR